jgi:Ice-binding-like
MTSINSPIRAGRSRTARRASALILAVAVSSAGLLVATAGGAQAIATAVPLGTADAYAVLAGAGITNTGPTTITGDVGTAPTPSITGKSDITLIPPSAYHQADAEAIQAKVNLTTGYTNAAGQSRTADSGAELGGQTSPWLREFTEPIPRSG